MDMIPSPNQNEIEQKAHQLYRSRFEEWSEEVDRTEVRKVTIKLDSAMNDVSGLIEIKAPIEKLDEIAEKLTDYDSRVREQVSEQIGRPTLMDCYEELKEEE